MNFGLLRYAQDVRVTTTRSALTRYRSFGKGACRPLCNPLLVSLLSLSVSASTSH